MSTVDGRSGETGGTASSGTVDLKLEVVVIPVADADRSKAFYAALGWRLDADFPSTTASGSCSSRHLDRCAPCSSAPDHRCPTRICPWPLPVVSDIDTGRHELMGRGAKVSEVFHSGAPGRNSIPRGQRSGQRAGSGSQELQLLCDVRRP